MFAVDASIQGDHGAAGAQGGQEYYDADYKVVDDDNKVIGVCRAFDIVDTLSDLYDIKVEKLYEAMEEELKGITWDELMEASAKVSTRTTGIPITAKEYENNIKNSTFGEAIWATGGLEKFFAGLISVGEIVIARKVGRAKRGAK